MTPGLAQMAPSQSVRSPRVARCRRRGTANGDRRPATGNCCLESPDTALDAAERERVKEKGEAGYVPVRASLTETVCDG